MKFISERNLINAQKGKDSQRTIELIAERANLSRDTTPHVLRQSGLDLFMA